MSTTTAAAGFTGTLASVPFADLLQLLSGGRKTGTLRLQNGTHTKLIFFKDGEIISSASDDPAEFLGQFLLFQGILTEDQLKQALEAQLKSGILIGKILVMSKMIREEVLVEMLVRKAEETILGVFLWEEGSFAFKEGELPTAQLIPISLKVQDLVLDGVKAIDDFQRIRTEFRSPRAILARSGPQPPPELLRDHLTRRIYERLDGKLSIPDLCLEFRCSELGASKALYTLYQQGSVKVVGAAAPPPPVDPATSPPALIATGEGLEQQGHLGPAIDFYRRALALSPLDVGLRKRIELVEAKFIDKAHKHYLPPTKIPILRKTLQELVSEPLSPQEGFLVSRINGTWDLRSIISISPLREVDALLCMDRLRRRGVIELVDPPEGHGAEEKKRPEPPPPVTD
jgi:hypothetical protein